MAVMPAGLFLLKSGERMKMERTAYEVKLLLGRLCMRLVSEVPLDITDEVRVFCTDTESEDITVHIRVMREKIRLPRYKCGEDLLLEYYYDEGCFIAAAKKGIKGSAAVTLYTPNFSEAAFYINEAEFPGIIRRVSKILQLFPIRQALAQHQAMILHSSRILTRGKAIIFTAPSQTGKTTQARLWKECENAEIVSNDRTLLQKNGQTFHTYGYPVDGSNPVYSSRELPLSSIVVLRQGVDNRTERLAAGKALKYLMQETVADVWNVEELAAMQNLWLDLLEEYPVYLLTCTPDWRAVQCLKEQLIKDGVISSDINQRQTL